MFANGMIGVVVDADERSLTGVSHDSRRCDPGAGAPHDSLRCDPGDGEAVEQRGSDRRATADVNPVDREFLILPAAVTKLLSRKEMLSDPAALKAVKKEADGLTAKGTWDMSSVREAEALKREAQSSGSKVHLGSLMSICSIKFAELAEHLQILKGRIVYRGDSARDEWGAAAIYQELNASPTSIQAANATIAYGCFPGNKVTSADAVKAYVQAHLNSEHPTWVAVPPELQPASWRGKYKKPIVRLIKALYGHPESGAHWQAHFEKILCDNFSAIAVDVTPVATGFLSRN